MFDINGDLFNTQYSDIGNFIITVLIIGLTDYKLFIMVLTTEIILPILFQL